VDGLLRNCLGCCRIVVWIGLSFIYPHFHYHPFCLKSMSHKRVFGFDFYVGSFIELSCFF
jgi:hypothetical protein